MKEQSDSINLSNYEVFLVDYLDGKLSTGDQKMLLAFLESHPDLKEEFESLSNGIIPQLSPSEDIYTDKSKLKKPFILGERECTYLDELAVKALEGDARLSELREHQNLLQNDQSYQKRFKILQLTLQKANLSIRFPYKSALKKRTLIPLTAGQWMRFSSVAATLAVLLLAADLFFNEPANSDQLAEYAAKTAIEEKNSETGQISADNQNKAAQSEPSVIGTMEDRTLIAAHQLSDNEMANFKANQQTVEGNRTVKADWKAKKGSQNHHGNLRNDLAALQSKQPRRLDPSLFTAEGERTYASLLPAALPAISFYTEDVEPSQQAISLSDYLLLRFKRDVLKMECDEPCNPELKLYEIADAGMNQINKLSKNRIQWEARRDSNGNLSAYNLKTPLLEINKPSLTSPEGAQ